MRVLVALSSTQARQKKIDLITKVIKREHPKLKKLDGVLDAHVEEIENISGKTLDKMSLAEVEEALDDLTSGPM